MKTVILAGGRGSRLQELTDEIPKPIIEIGGEPILKHIMDIYARQGFREFIICGGYKIDVIGAWLDRAGLPWNIRLIDTGQDTLTGGRIKRVERHLSDQFFLTYGDGIGDVDLQALTCYHNKHQSYCTVTAVHPPPRFGELAIEGDYVARWSEKQRGPGWINGGFYVVEPEALDFIQGDEPWEYGACVRMVERHLMTNYKHDGFWACMDTLKDVQALREMWEKGALWTGKISA